MSGIVASGVVVLVGCGIVFAGVAPRGRLAGLSIMAAGAVLSLVFVDADGTVPWWTVVTAGATLLVMLLVAAHLGRWSARPGGSDGGGPSHDDGTLDDGTLDDGRP